MGDPIEQIVGRWILELADDFPPTRERAFYELLTQPLERVVGPICEYLLENPGDTSRETLLELLETRGAAISLAEIQTVDWFDQVGAHLEHFEQICEIMGRRYLAYAIILGIQIRSLSVDPRFSVNTSIEFSVDNDQIQTLPLIEFQTEVVQSILHMRRGGVDAELPLSGEQAAAVIGGTWLLISSLFDISFEYLLLADPDAPRFLVGCASKDGFRFLELNEIDEMIKGKVRRDLAGLAEEPFKLDLSGVELARDAFEKGEFDDVIRILESWPGLLSVLNRTPMAKNLPVEKREQIGAGLELLGASFEQRHRREWSEELYKLGLQFIKEGAVAARLFGRVGLLLHEMDRHGEAIGLLRRARQLGVEKDDIAIALGLSYLYTGKNVAAVALLADLVRKGVSSPSLATGLDEVNGRLNTAGVTWNIPTPAMR